MIFSNESCHDRMMRWLFEFVTIPTDVLCPKNPSDRCRKSSQDIFMTYIQRRPDYRGDFSIVIPPESFLTEPYQNCLGSLVESFSNRLYHWSTDDTGHVQNFIREAIESIQMTFDALSKYEDIMESIKKWYEAQVSELNRPGHRLKWLNVMRFEKRHECQHEMDKCSEVLSSLQTTRTHFAAAHDKWKRLENVDEPRPLNQEIIASNVLPRDLLKIVDDYYFHPLFIDGMLTLLKKNIEI